MATPAQRKNELLLRFSRYQIRVHGDEWDKIAHIFQHYIEQADTVLVFKHVNGKNERPHFHIYLINIAITEQAIRKYLKNYFKGNKDFSVKANAGTVMKEGITPYGAYQYGANDSKDYMEELTLVDPIFTKGIGELLLRDYKDMAKVFYEKEIQRIKALNEENTKPMVMYREKADNTWERLFEKYHRLSPANRPQEYAAVKRWIELDYLNRAKPVRRNADLHRYAMSLSLIRNGMVSEEELIQFKIENRKSEE